MGVMYVKYLNRECGCKKGGTACRPEMGMGMCRTGAGMGYSMGWEWEWGMGMCRPRIGM